MAPPCRYRARIRSAAADAVTQVALAVFRDIRGDDQREARSAVLAAFVGHAALTATNARLYEEVEDALRHQVDLNRQKDDFLAVLSHELRNPLAPLRTGLDLLLQMQTASTTPVAKRTLAATMLPERSPTPYAPITSA